MSRILGAMTAYSIMIMAILMPLGVVATCVAINLILWNLAII